MTKCMYCHTALENNVVVDVCRPCGLQVWGERMFNAILQNMNDAREKGDLYQGSVTQSVPEKQSFSQGKSLSSSSPSATPSLLQPSTENLGPQSPSPGQSPPPRSPSPEAHPRSAPAPSPTTFTPQPSLTPPTPHLSSESKVEKTVYTEEDEVQLKGPDSSTILQDVDRLF